MPGLVALLLYYRGLSGTKASYATLAEISFPASAVVLNWAFLGVAVSTNQILGFALLAASCGGSEDEGGDDTGSEGDETTTTVNRDDIVRGAQDFGVDLTEHIQFVIDAMKPIASELELLQGSGDSDE